MTSESPGVTVVVMVYNEVNTLETVVREIVSALDGLEQTGEVLVVDDGSTDGTAEVADRLAEELVCVRVVHHGVNQGLGGVYRTGFSQAKGDFVTFFPADGQFSASIIPKFVSSMANADMVLGYLPDRRRSLLGMVLSTVERILYRLLFGRLPKFQGVLMFKRSLLDGLELRSTGRSWVVLMEFIIRVSRGGYRAVSIPTEVHPRVSGKSKVNNLSTIWASIRGLIALRRCF